MPDNVSVHLHCISKKKYDLQPVTIVCLWERERETKNRESDRNKDHDRNKK